MMEKFPSKDPGYVSTYYKEWYSKNKGTHLAKMKEKIICKCGRKVNKCHLQRHMRSEIHKQLVK